MKGWYATLLYCQCHNNLQWNYIADQQRAQEQVLELLPMISEVNAVSEELNKYRQFELVLISAGYQEEKDKGTKYIDLHQFVCVSI